MVKTRAKHVKDEKLRTHSIVAVVEELDASLSVESSDSNPVNGENIKTGARTTASRTIYLRRRVNEELAVAKCKAGRRVNIIKQHSENSEPRCYELGFELLAETGRELNTLLAQLQL